MTLALTIEDAETLDNGQPTLLELDRHGAIIGRSPHADWSLPDARKLISSRHCEIAYRDGRYLLTDLSTNGTFLNGSTDRLQVAHALVDGDRIAIGHYAIVAKHRDVALPSSPVAAETDGWGSFDVADEDRRDGSDDGWADPPVTAAERGNGWRAAPPETAPARVAGIWDLPAPVARPSAWSSAPTQPLAPTANDLWGRLAGESEIDWSRGNFVAVAPSSDDWGPSDRPSQMPNEEAGINTDGAVSPRRDSVAKGESSGQSQASQDAFVRFMEAAGLPSDRFTRAPVEALAAAGALLRQLVGGLMLMIEARARAKAQLGVQATGLELDGNNVLKFVRSPERALLQLLDESQSGFMPAERAIEDAYQDLQAHQMASLSAMRGALEGTLSRFSPTAIRDRTGAPRRFARWFPALHRARQWDAYERDFEGVLRGADDAFMELFAKEFRRHYDRQIDDMKARRRDAPG